MGSTIPRSSLMGILLGIPIADVKSRSVPLSSASVSTPDEADDLAISWSSYPATLLGSSCCGSALNSDADQRVRGGLPFARFSGGCCCDAFPMDEGHRIAPSLSFCGSPDRRTRGSSDCLNALKHELGRGIMSLQSAPSTDHDHDAYRNRSSLSGTDVWQRLSTEREAGAHNGGAH
ncbi:hypothetical protein FOA52_011998 [Chlamydomonas sp. UWO 241]|nr:hypothetical protein FOA52_011998 [Chlamydomonas sp. UWO 241]